MITGKSAEGPKEAARRGAKSNQPEPCGSASTELSAANAEDGAGEQAGAPNRDPVVLECWHRSKYGRFSCEHGGLHEQQPHNDQRCL
jgi:hypothetical protein